MGPFPVSAESEALLDQRFKLASAWKTANLHIAAFVQSEATGNVLQALALPYCR